MEIPFSSPVLIKNVYNNGYLTFEKMGLVSISNQSGTLSLNSGNYVKRDATPSDETYRIPVKTFSEKASIYEVVTHFVDLSVEDINPNPMPWQFQLHFKDGDNDSLIQHDIVYL